MIDSSPLLKHKHGNIFNLIRTQAGSFLLGCSILFTLLPVNNVYSGAIVDGFDQSISLKIHHILNTTKL